MPNDTEAERRLDELLDTIISRMKDSASDLQAAIKCIETYRADPNGAQACILEYLKTGTAPPEH